jgi:membrane fusion protein (multidrug efflux system)
VNERFGLDFFAAAKGETMQQKLTTLPPVILRLANGAELPDKGKVETTSGLINVQTGSVNMRPRFPIRTDSYGVGTASLSGFQLR